MGPKTIRICRGPCDCPACTLVFLSRTNNRGPSCIRNDSAMDTGILPGNSRQFMGPKTKKPEA